MKYTSINIDNIVSLLANVLYLIEKQHFNVDRAFTYTCRRYRCSSPQFTREDLFNLAHEFVSKYLMVKSIAGYLGRKNVSYRMCAKLFLYLKLKDLSIPIPSKLSKIILRDFGRIDIDEVLQELKPWELLSYPQWIYNRLVEVLQEDEVKKMLDAMNRRIVWLRINTLKIDIDKAIKMLDAEGV